ncbi:MAG: M15 family metallopeptidase [Lachnospiraceae bacterium]|nr:M15 family metallopeptidase [Lachnospiraceae bacterium]
MDEMRERSSKRRNSRGGNSGRLLPVMLVLCFLLALALAAALVQLHKKQSQIRELILEQTQLQEEYEKKSEELAGYSLAAEGSEMSAAREEADGAEKEMPEGEAREMAEGETGEISAEAPEESSGEAPEETEPIYLESLSGLEPGTIIPKERLDFSHLDRYFMSWEIEEGDNLYQRINGKSYRKNDYVPLNTLRYLKMPHYNFNGEIQVGELIVNQDVMEDVFQIFKELFQAEYQIQSMYLVDNYWTGDPDSTDSASIDVNNTSAFCYRQITGGGRLSNHAYGRAIDLNPQQNPYVSYSSGSPKWAHANADAYIARDTGLPHVITHDDLAYQVFAKYGFRWGGDWNNPKDYQHFDRNQ